MTLAGLSKPRQEISVSVHRGLAYPDLTRRKCNTKPSGITEMPICEPVRCQERRRRQFFVLRKESLADKRGKMPLAIEALPGATTSDT
ncbi:hypothetical protein VFPPC_15382 [Pochonia chlamydosporia 170]|uniref:Uncharacterized protein n=1 Tax=Pochonia chlamydosporia 170 TaxID=1380566 RepID=A0A179G918_METCM|nr:hypothetical protein VFPPC_15382 [Pochonia chlamydosporia 170]OAQ73911.1 hypothetical protein VFPPC_15382 [Pochonia chlamydosporia 170]